MHVYSCTYLQQWCQILLQCGRKTAKEYKFLHSVVLIANNCNAFFFFLETVQIAHQHACGSSFEQESTGNCRKNWGVEGE